MTKFPDNEVLARYLSGECSEEEIILVDTWAKSSPGNKKILARMEYAWNNGKLESLDWDIEKLWQKILDETGIELNSGKKVSVAPFIQSLFSSRLLRITAVLLITFSAPYMILKAHKYANENIFTGHLEKIIVENGKRMHITLADSSKVILDAGSEFLYSRDFANGTREVYLNGEAYFEVARDEQKPFIVHSNNARITVLGTSFNVRAWEETNTVKVSVTEGKVSLRQEESPEKNSEAIITKGFLSILRGKNKPTAPEKTDINSQLAWLKFEMEFTSTPFREVLNQLQRWYDLEISLEETALGEQRINVYISKQPVEDILKLLSMVMNLDYKMTGNKVVFSGEKKDTN